jgi:hypothetical protein
VGADVSPIPLAFAETVAPKELLCVRWTFHRFAEIRRLVFSSLNAQWFSVIGGEATDGARPLVIGAGRIAAEFLTAEWPEFKLPYEHGEPGRVLEVLIKNEDSVAWLLRGALVVEELEGEREWLRAEALPARITIRRVSP